jgi:hypothetical protein
MADLKQASTAIQGVLGVDDVQAAKQVIDMSPSLQKLYKNDTPLFRIFNMLPKGPTATNYKINWLTKDEYPLWNYLTTSVAAGSAGATVTLIPATTSGGSADTTRFKVGDVVQVPDVVVTDSVTNLGVITQVNSGVSIVVDPIGYDSNGDSTDKAFGATTANSEIYTLHDASEEYSQSPTAKVVKDGTEWNYINFQRVPYIIGNIEKDMKQYSGPERTERSDETMKLARRGAENALIWGDRYKIATGAGGNGAQFFMRGFWEYIRVGAGSNILSNWTAGLSEKDWDEYLTQGPCKLGYGGNTRFLFCSTELYLKLHSLMKDKTGNLPEASAFGMTFEKYKAPGGKTILIKEHALFSNAHEGKGLIVDPTMARIRPYGTQGTLRLLRDIQENDRAGIKDEWQSIFSLQLNRMEPHGIITP